MKKNKIKTGSLIKIPLEHNLGFVIAKFINLNEIIPKPNYNEFIYVYNQVFQSEEVEIDNISDYDYLTGGLFVLDLPPVVRNKKWEIIGHLDPNPNELKIPDFKDFGPVFTMYEKDARIWYCIKNFEINNRIVVDYDQVKHLEKFVYKSHDVIERRLTMEVLRQTGKQIDSYYKLEEWNELAPYYNTIYTPVYSTIPIEIRGKALL